MELQWRIQGGAHGAPPKGPDYFVLSHKFNIAVAGVGAPMRLAPSVGNPESATELSYQVDIIRSTHINPFDRKPMVKIAVK